MILTAISLVLAASKASLAAPLEPGFTYQVYEIATPIERVWPLAPNQDPNLDEVRGMVNFPLTEEFGPIKDNFLARCTGFIKVPKAGEYEFLLTSDDGAILTIDGKEVANNDGLHDVKSVTGKTSLSEGLHSFEIQYLEGQGEEVLRLEWMPPGRELFGLIPADAYFTESRTNRPTKPGAKMLATNAPAAGGINADIAGMIQTSRGARITFNRPIKTEILEDVSNYSATTWNLQSYNKVDEQKAEVVSATASGDGRSVTLAIFGLKRGRELGVSFGSKTAQVSLKMAPAFVAPPKPMRVLVFSRTTGFRHDSIETGVECIRQLGKENSFEVDWTEDPFQFKPEILDKYQVVVFLNTTGDILDKTQEAAFEKFIKKGRGFVGIHAAADTEYDWAWYGDLVGAYFMSHPAIQKANVDVIDRNHPATSHLQAVWTRTDEWYDFKAAPKPGVRILMKLDTNSYQNHKMGENHPTCWSHKFGGGRAFYTGGGHTKECYADSDFRKHILGGIMWAAKKKN